MRIIAAGIKGELNMLHINYYCTTLGNLELVAALQGRGETTSVNAKEALPAAIVREVDMI